MNEYSVTVLVDASRNYTVKAESPEAAVEQAEERYSQESSGLCHQCSGKLDVGGAVGAIVYCEDNEVLDTSYQAARIATLEAENARQEQHPDDAAVDRFAVAMKAKLAKSREKGRHGWQNASAAHLSSLLYRHVYKADPLDVANLAMMLHQNGQAIELPHEARHEQGDEVRRLREALEHCSEVMKDPWKHGEGCISRAINRADAALAASAEGCER